MPVLMQNIPVWIGWFHYLDFLHYAWAALMLNEFEQQPATFIDNQTVQSDLFIIILLLPMQCVAIKSYGLVARCLLETRATMRSPGLRASILSVMIAPDIFYLYHALWLQTECMVSPWW